MAVTAIVRVYQPFQPVLQWLQDNVGPMVQQRDFIYSHGKGWHLTIGHEVAQRGKMGRPYCTVEFEDEIHAIWFELIWG